jgi:hypothetical protein
LYYRRITIVDTVPYPIDSTKVRIIPEKAKFLLPQSSLKEGAGRMCSGAAINSAWEKYALVHA